MVLFLSQVAFLRHIKLLSCSRRRVENQEGEEVLKNSMRLEIECITGKSFIRGRELLLHFVEYFYILDLCILVIVSFR